MGRRCFPEDEVPRVSLDVDDRAAFDDGEEPMERPT
jgi:hypothetical protein